MVTDFLLRASLSQVSVSPRLVGVPKCRQASPPTGCSTFSTSAPNSPRMLAQYGAAITVATSMTRMPARGSSSRGCAFMLNDPLLAQGGSFGSRQLEQLAHHLVGGIAKRRPEVGDAPRRLGQRGDDIRHDHRANPVFLHRGQVPARPEMLVLENVGNAVELADGHLLGKASLEQ